MLCRELCTGIYASLSIGLVWMDGLGYQLESVSPYLGPMLPLNGEIADLLDLDFGMFNVNALEMR